LGQLSYILRRTHKLEPKNKEPNELDRVTQYFTTLIQEAAWYSTPAPNKENNILLHIRELVTEKRRARSEWQR
jgi:hypothetical protein